jgi:ribonuclease PH
VTIEKNVQEFAEGSALITAGRTHVLCAATVEEEVPRWMRGKGRGWVTAEYAMLPRATNSRNRRESGGRLKGRTQEIQRLIGRSLRSSIDLQELGERAVWIDCDVIQADGGTRTASITGAWVALSLALDAVVESGRLTQRPVLTPLSAISVGLVEGRALLDLDYTEDVSAEVDMNLVINGDGHFVEVQGTAEGASFRREQLDELLDLGAAGCGRLQSIQADAAGR